MKFFKKSLSEKLTRLGCVSEIKFYYNCYDGSECVNPIYCPSDPREIKAFSVYDLISDEEYVWDNCVKIFGNDFAAYYCRPILMSSKDQEAYVEEWANKMIENGRV